MMHHTALHQPPPPSFHPLATTTRRVSYAPADAIAPQMLCSRAKEVEARKSSPSVILYIYSPLRHLQNIIEPLFLHLK